MLISRENQTSDLPISNPLPRHFKSKFDARLESTRNQIIVHTLLFHFNIGNLIYFTINLLPTLDDFILYVLKRNNSTTSFLWHIFLASGINQTRNHIAAQIRVEQCICNWNCNSGTKCSHAFIAIFLGLCSSCLSQTEHPISFQILTKPGVIKILIQPLTTFGFNRFAN